MKRLLLVLPFLFLLGSCTYYMDSDPIEAKVISFNGTHTYDKPLKQFFVKVVTPDKTKKNSFGFDDSDWTWGEKTEKAETSEEMVKIGLDSAVVGIKFLFCEVELINDIVLNHTELLSLKDATTLKIYVQVTNEGNMSTWRASKDYTDGSGIKKSELNGKGRYKIFFNTRMVAEKFIDEGVWDQFKNYYDKHNLEVKSKG